MWKTFFTFPQGRGLSVYICVLYACVCVCVCVSVCVCVKGAIITSWWPCLLWKCVCLFRVVFCCLAISHGGSQAWAGQEKGSASIWGWSEVGGGGLPLSLLRVGRRKRRGVHSSPVSTETPARYRSTFFSLVSWFISKTFQAGVTPHTHAQWASFTLTVVYSELMLKCINLSIWLSSVHHTVIKNKQSKWESVAKENIIDTVINSHLNSLIHKTRYGKTMWIRYRKN